MNIIEAKIAINKLIRWDDKSQLDVLVKNGYLTPLPMHVSRAFHKSDFPPTAGGWLREIIDWHCPSGKLRRFLRTFDGWMLE